MSTSTRQTSLLVAQDWKKVYQTFREADFQSYDFETIRKSMIDYLRLYYPEDFNDFIESSEYIALIDLIAFLGQSLAFRTDLNARENFLDTAERRDSILKLARLVSYSPKRSTAASGLLKIISASTTETLLDSNGVDLSNLVVTWNDGSNVNWQEQFSLILNATLINSQTIGKSGNSQVINGIKTDEYAINITSQTVPAFPFTASVGGSNITFEAVSATSVGQSYIYEVDPKPIAKFNILYRNDNQGNGSNNTGFFTYFKQGNSQSVDFKISESMPNRILNVGYNNINNSDVWLYSLNSSGNEDVLWSAVPTVAGINVIYNKMVDRNLYQINTRAGDQIDLVFGDGSFANIPQGLYRLRFRTSIGSSYKITPDEIQGAAITMNYVSRAGNIETLTIRANLNYTVTNATSSESLADIRQKAPQQYYTQGRMITGEDYNIIPYTTFSNILKVKAVNRTSSGISRYLDVNDFSGKYSSTNIFAQDGFLYKEDFINSMNFTVLSSVSVQRVVQDDLTNILSSKEIEHFYYSKFSRYGSPNTVWHMSTTDTNGSTGYFYDPTNNDKILQLGYVTSNSQKYIRIGAILKFAAPPGYYFNSQNQIVPDNPLNPGPQLDGDHLYIYSTIKQVVGDGTNGGIGNFANGVGTVTLSQNVPTGALIADYGIIPVFKNSLPSELTTKITAKLLAYNNFGLRYDLATEYWNIIEETNLNTDAANPFSLDYQGNTTSQGLDASWIIRFEYSNNIGYTIYWRGINYVFESLLETKFYFDDKVKIYDSKTATVIQDQIKILKVNTEPDSSYPLGIDYTWHIFKNIVDIDGYENQNKVLITFADNNVDGIPDNPDIFDVLVKPELDSSRVFFQRQVNSDSFITYSPISSTLINTDYDSKAGVGGISANVTLFIDGQLFYAKNDNKFYQYNATSTGDKLPESTEYEVKPGRGNLYFQYRHNSPGYRRIDPSPNNIIDLFLLTESYSTDYTNWIKDTTNTLAEPAPPTTDELKLEYSKLENYKAISDTIIYNSAKFKPLFGAKAVSALQAIFKVVKNPAYNVSDNDVKSSVISAINTYFSVDNWDFGETFYFSELSAYLHSVLSPNVSSLIIVPVAPSAIFGSLYQINAEANEILTSSATVDDVEIISAITSSSINANFLGASNSAAFGAN
jgi:hypothetical protein